MKSIKRAIAVVLLIAMLLFVGFLGFTCKRVTNETSGSDICENTAFDKNSDTMAAFTGEIE